MYPHVALLFEFGRSYALVRPPPAPTSFAEFRPTFPCKLAKRRHRRESYGMARAYNEGTFYFRCLHHYS